MRVRLLGFAVPMAELVMWQVVWSFIQHARHKQIADQALWSTGHTPWCIKSVRFSGIDLTHSLMPPPQSAASLGQNGDYRP
jgi:hypothetical protein